MVALREIETTNETPLLPFIIIHDSQSEPTPVSGIYCSGVVKSPWPHLLISDLLIPGMPNQSTLLAKATAGQVAPCRAGAQRSQESNFLLLLLLQFRFFIHPLRLIFKINKIRVVALRENETTDGTPSSLKKAIANLVNVLL